MEAGFAPIGLDLSVTSTGVAHAHGTVALKPKRLSGARRLKYLRDGLAEQLVIANPTHAVKEGYAHGMKGAGVRSIAEWHGVCDLLLFEWGIPLCDVNPMHLKIYALGAGNVEKSKMLREGHKRFGIDFTTDDECDAYFLYAMALDYNGTPLVQMPGQHRRALDSVSWWREHGGGA